ncbi:pilus assembly protein [Solimonas fluminis]|nr:PilC/PilY family type IV pilus protein [Solimonas fluminis]
MNTQKAGSSLASLFLNRIPLREAAALAAFFGAAALNPAWADPAQSPLLTRSENPAKPNVMFTFDDSGSMAWRFMPDAASWSTTNAVRWSTTFHPLDDATFGNGGSGDGVQLVATRPNFRTSSTTTVCSPDTQFADCRALDLISARMRSSAWNTVYYNPEIRYQPWYNSDGSQFPNSPPTAAWLNPNNRVATDSVDLTGLQPIPSGTYVCRSSTTTTPNTTLTADRNKTATCGPISTAPVGTAIAYGTGNCTAAVLGTTATYNGTGTGSSTYCRLTAPTTQAQCTTLTGDSANWTSSQCRVNSSRWATATFCTTRLGGVWLNSACYPGSADEAFAPATYYEYVSGATSTSEAQNYRRIRIMDYSTFTRGAGRTDCTVSGSTSSCTQAQEYQNFANWFTYYRTRNYLSIASASRAFSEQGTELRVGYGRINKASASVDGTAAATVQRGVRTFTGNDRTAFFNWLYTVPASGGTPLRRAMDDVGKYYQRTDNRGPWGNTPGTDDGVAVNTHLQCRKSYHILMTDGFWNGDTASSTINGSNVDNVAGPTITGPNSQSYRYVKARPYQDASDSTTGTLADVAMYYWNRDLRTDLDNRVKPDAKNPAFWQHMVNFTVGLGVGGTLTYPDDIAALQAGTKNWPVPVGDTSTAVDDLWHAAVNSRGEYLSAKDPDEFAASLSSILNEITVRNASEGGVAATAATLQAGNRKYVPEYKTAIWTGNLTAYELDQFGQQLSPIWNAASSLPAHGSRNIFVGTRNGTPKAETFTWSGMSAGVKADLPGATENLVNYLRGDATYEGGLYRERASRLGDFVNSQPVYVKSLVDMQYNFLPNGTAGRTTYKQFLTDKAARTGVVFIGGNDGMLHAFRDSDGREIFGFIPRILLQYLPALASTSYEHRFYVDGQLSESDAYLGGGWKNVLVGATGAGARAVFALDVTSTSTMNAGNVLWEMDSTTQSELGYVMAPIEIGLMKNGQWAAIFGNGPNSNSGTAQLFIVNLQTGALISRIQASTATGNGLGGVRVIRDANRVIVGAYAGDLLGNVWKFDLASTSSGSWGVSFGGTPLFQAGSTKPITAAPQYLAHPLGGYMVLVGTGKLYDEGDQATTTQQALYGLWDKQQLTVDGSGVASWATITPADAQVLSSALANHAFNSTTINGPDGAIYYRLTTAPLNWATQRGWTLPLTIVAGHRNLLSPSFIFGFALFETMSPTTQGALNPCDDTGTGGAYNLLINPIDGTMPQSALFDTNGDGYVNSSDTIVAGYRGTWDGRDVVLAQKPCLNPDDCPPDPENRCEDGTKLVSVQSAIGGNSNICVKLPPRERWWWRQIQQVPE